MKKGEWWIPEFDNFSLYYTEQEFLTAYQLFSSEQGRKYGFINTKTPYHVMGHPMRIDENNPEYIEACRAEFKKRATNIIGQTTQIIHCSLNQLKNLHKLARDCGGGACCSHWTKAYSRFRLGIGYSCLDEIAFDFIQGSWDPVTFNRNATPIPNRQVMALADAEISDIYPYSFPSSQDAQNFMKDTKNVPIYSFGIIGSSKHWVAWSKDYTGRLITHEWIGKYHGIVDIDGISISDSALNVKIFHQKTITPYSNRNNNNDEISRGQLEGEQYLPASKFRGPNKEVNDYGIPHDRFQRYNTKFNLDGTTPKDFTYRLNTCFPFLRTKANLRLKEQNSIEERARRIWRVTELSEHELNKMSHKQAGLPATWKYMTQPASFFRNRLNKMKTWEEWCIEKRYNRLKRI